MNDQNQTTIHDGDPALEAAAREKYEAWRRRHRSDPVWDDLHEWQRGNWRNAVRVDWREAARGKQS